MMSRQDEKSTSRLAIVVPVAATLTVLTVLTRFGSHLSWIVSGVVAVGGLAALLLSARRK